MGAVKLRVCGASNFYCTLASAYAVAKVFRDDPAGATSPPFPYRGKDGHPETRPCATSGEASFALYQAEARFRTPRKGAVRRPDALGARSLALILTLRLATRRLQGYAVCRTIVSATCYSWVEFHGQVFIAELGEPQT
jgi:hypothetical protein